ncbi:MAG TPA: hypothetical protein VGS60_12540 [Actinomycetes bacterium]|jgi:hypothetical protein|nr:hypothetical protein [Actinomycetes bacterium]
MKTSCTQVGSARVIFLVRVDAMPLEHEQVGGPAHGEITELVAGVPAHIRTTALDTSPRR